MFKLILFVAISIEVFSQTDAILEIRWQKAPTDIKESKSHLMIDCFTELRWEHIDKIIAVNPDSVIPGAACLIRIPTKVEIMFLLDAVHKKSTLHILTGNTSLVKGPLSANLNRRGPFQNSLPDLEYVGCNYATISFKPRDSYDKLVFLMKHARPELIENENVEKCI